MKTNETPDKHSASHTPGPWPEARFTGDHKRLIIEKDGPGDDNWKRLCVEVDSDDCDTDTAVANARLIAAAPDLLACVRSALRVGISLPYGLREQFEIALAKAEAAK